MRIITPIHRGFATLIVATSFIACRDSLPTGVRSTQGAFGPGSLEIAPPELVVEHGDSAVVTVSVFDGRGGKRNLSAGAVDWSSSHPGIASVGDDGVIRARHPGSTTLTVFYLGSEVRLPIEVKPIATDVRFVIPMTTLEGVAGERLADSASVRVVDQGGLGVEGVRIDFVVEEGGGKASPTETYTDADGYARTEWVLGVSAGNNILVASAPKLNTVETASGGGPGSTTKFKANGKSGNPKTATVEPAWFSLQDGDSKNLKLSATDKHGNPVDPSSVTWSSSSSVIATVDPTGTVVARSPGSATITATVAARPRAITANAQVSVLPAGAGIVRLGGDGQSAPIYSALPQPLDVRVRDANGTPVSGVAVTWSVGESGGVTSPGQGVTNENGEASTTWTLGSVPGEHLVTVTANGYEAVQFSATALPGAPATVTVTPESTDLDVGDGIQLTAEVRDESGNVMPSAGVAWTSSNASIVQVDAAGFATGVGSGTATVTATSGQASGSAAVRVLGNPPAIARVEVSPTSHEFAQIGEQKIFVARAYDGSGNEIHGVTFGWESSNSSVAVVDETGSVEVLSVGAAVITVFAGCCSAEAQVSLSPPAPASVTVAPSTSSLAPGGNVQLSAVVRDTRGDVIPDANVSWSSSNTSLVSVGGEGLASAGSGSGVATITATSGSASGTAQVSVESAGQVEGAIAVRVHRLDGGSGSVLVSSGVPLQPGELFPGEGNQVRLVIGGQEKPLYVEELAGRHQDGSLRAVLLQFEQTVSAVAPVDGLLEYGPGVSPSSTRSKASVTYSVGAEYPRAALLPSSPDYLISTDLVGETATPAASRYPALDSKFAEWEPHQWSTNQTWVDNYYDRGLVYYAWWIRTGNPDYFKKAAHYVVRYREEYVIPTGYKTPPRWALTEGLELHYLLTGDASSRTAVGRMADHLTVWLGQLDDAATNQWLEGRIQARTLMSQLIALRLDAPSSTGQSWSSNVSRALNEILSSQASDGHFRYGSQCGEQLNYMTGMLMDAFIKYHRWYQADSRILTSVRRAADALWASEWMPNHGGSKEVFYYTTGECDSNTRTAGSDLNGFFLNGYAWIYKMTGETTSRARADAIARGLVNHTYFYGSKQFNEAFHTSFRGGSFAR